MLKAKLEVVLPIVSVAAVHISATPFPPPAPQIEDAKAKLDVVPCKHPPKFPPLALAPQIEDAKAKLEVVTALHVYSVQPGVPKVR